MHPSLVNFSWYTAMDILGTDDLSTSFLQDVGLLPKKTHTFPCPKCGKEMEAQGEKSRKMKWRFRCNKTFCNGSMSPLENTVFKNVQLSFNEVLAIIFEFVRETPVTHTVRRISEWRKYRSKKHIDAKTVIDFYSFCRNVCQIVASQMSVEALGTLKAAESYYRVNRLPKSLSEGEMIWRYLEDIKSVFPGPCWKGLKESQSSPVDTFTHSSANDKVSTISDKDESCLHENFVNSFQNTSGSLSSNKDKSFLDKNVVNSPEKKRYLLIFNEDIFYPCESFANSSESIGDPILSDDELSPREDINCPVKNSCITLLNGDKSCHNENILYSPVNKKRCITDESYHEENIINSSVKQIGISASFS